MGHVRSVVVDERVVIDYLWDGSKTTEIVVDFEVKNWCDENTAGWEVRYLRSYGYDAKGYYKVVPQHRIVFKTVNDAVKFKLRWQ